MNKKRDLTDRQKKLLKMFKSKEEVTTVDIADCLGIDRRHGTFYANGMIDKGHLELIRIEPNSNNLGTQKRIYRWSGYVPEKNADVSLLMECFNSMILCGVKNET